MDEIDRMTIENIRFHGKRCKMTKEEIDILVDLYTKLPLINTASVQEIKEAIEKCANMNK